MSQDIAPQAAAPSWVRAEPEDPVLQLTLQALMTQADLLVQQGQADAAQALYLKWTQGSDSPLVPAALFNRGVILSNLGRHREALECYRQALERQPGFAPAWLNAGHVHEREGRPEQALACWEQVHSGACGPTPGAPSDTAGAEHLLHALNQAARLLEQLKRLPEAEALMRRSLEIRSDQLDVVQHYVHARQKQCAWPVDEPAGSVTPHQFLMGTSALATMALHDDPAVQLLAATRFVHHKVPKVHAGPMHLGGPPRSGRVRIGYLSGDLHHHAVGLLTAELFELHDRDRFEVFGFCWTPASNSPLRQRILQALDHHVPLAAVDDASAAQQITQAGIDVLVDLQGLTSGARPAILAHRPAPVQVSYLGLPGTSALPGVEWILADRFVMPPELLPFCSEKPLYLPHCFQVSDRQRPVGPVPTREACGLPPEGFVYCSFNNNHKFTPEMFGCWMRILHQVPGSALWLLADNETAQANLLNHARQAGISPGRLVFAPRVSPADYLARFACADLMLDTFPYNAGTTASDGLWMGTPIVTLAGRTYISRMAGSLLNAAGLPELVTHNLAEYERLAVALGRTPARAGMYRRYLQQEGRRSPLFDVPAIVRAIEDALEPLALASRK
jgi:predicted O-linked N-acetylglucosamine transferase (SPINDLY family)